MPMSPYIYAGLNQLDKNNFKISNRNFNRTPDELIRFICDRFNVTRAEVEGQSRKRKIVIPRQISMHLIRRLFPNISLEKIGEFFDGRDHSTVLYSINTVNNLIDTDRKFKQEYNELIKFM